MSARRVTIAGAAVLGLAALLLSFTSDAGRQKIVFATAWSRPTPVVQSITVGPFLPGGGEAIAVEGTGGVAVLGVDGTERARVAIPQALTTATGDLDGDGVQEIVVAANTTPPEVTAFDGALAPRWVHRLTGQVARPVRVAVMDLDGDRRPEVVLADERGGVVVFHGTDGRLRWYAPWPSMPNAEPRGIGDLPAATGRVAVVVPRNGPVRAFDAAGKIAWSWSPGGDVRRARFIDGDGDGAPEAHVGLEDGRYLVVDGAGKAAVRAALDSGVSEIRRLELDGDPGVTEVAVGGKDGLVRVVRTSGIAMESRVDGKITGLGGVDVDGDGRDELFVGTEQGELFVLDKGGRTLARHAAGGKVERILAVAGPAGLLPVVGAGSAVTAMRLDVVPPPAWHSRPAAALLALLLVALSGAGVRRLGALAAPAATPLTPREAARARVEALLAAGAARPEKAQERLAELDQPEAPAAPRAPRVPPPPPRR